MKIKKVKKGDRLNKTNLNNFLNQSESKTIELIKYDELTNEYEIRICGKISNMKYSKGFEDTMFDFMKEVKDFMKETKGFMKETKSFMKEQREWNNKVDKRLDNIESEIKDIKECPTIKRELKSSK